MKVVMKWVNLTTVLIVFFLLYSVGFALFHLSDTGAKQFIKIPLLLLALDIFVKAILLILVKSYVRVRSGGAITEKSLSVAKWVTALTCFFSVGVCGFITNLILEPQAFESVIPFLIFMLIMFYRLGKTEITIENDIVYIDISADELKP